MRKTITILALVFLIWLVLNFSHVVDLIFSFLLVGALPGTNIDLSPTMMLAIITAIGGTIIFELLARRIGTLRKVRNQFIEISKKQQLPKRRLRRA